MSSGYELHQKLRTKVVRLTKKKAYAEAIGTLHTGALSLLAQEEQGSGCDLGIYMLEVYGLAETPVDTASRGRIVEIIQAAKPDFWRKKLVDAAVKWSCRSEPAGDAELRLFVAKLYASEAQFELAEAQFLAASTCSDEAAKEFGRAMAEWLAAVAKQATEVEGEQRTQDAIERIEAGRFALRAVLPLLANRAVGPAVAFVHTYLEALTARLKSLLLPISPNPRPYTTPAGQQTAFRLAITANAELNFAQMATALSLAAQSGLSEPIRSAWLNLVRQFERESHPDPQTAAAIAQIGASLFGIAQRKQGNALSDMMASLFNSPAPTANNAIAQPPQPQPTPALAPPAKPSAADDLVDDEMD